MPYQPTLSIVRRVLLMTSVGASMTAASALASPALVRLSSRELRADIAPAHGGDLAGLEVRRGGRWLQLLYRGDDYAPTTDWPGKAPILWPATGRSFGGGTESKSSDSFSWSLDGVRYPIAIHGFARDLPWNIRRRGRSDIVLELRDSAQTRLHYPFGFTFTTAYSLKGDALTIRQTVHAAAANGRAMPFSIGNHMTFNLPLSPGGSPGAVRFQTAGRKQIETDAAGKPTGQVKPLDFSAPTSVSALKTREAVSVGDYPSTPSVRLIDPSGLAVTISHVESERPAGEPVLFNLWADVGKGFFAPEPWVGKQNSLATGDGVIALKPGQDFTWAVTVRVNPAA